MNQSNGTASLDPLFKARRVAVLGASSDPSKIGGIPVVLLRDNFSGEIIPVNPNRSEIAGLPCCPDIASIDGKVELAIIALPRGLVEKGVTECLDAGVDAIVLFTAGFGEIDGGIRGRRLGIGEQSDHAQTIRDCGGRPASSARSVGFRPVRDRQEFPTRAACGPAFGSGRTVGLSCAGCG